MKLMQRSLLDTKTILKVHQIGLEMPSSNLAVITAVDGTESNLEGIGIYI